MSNLLDNMTQTERDLARENDRLKDRVANLMEASSFEGTALRGSFFYAYCPIGQAKKKFLYGFSKSDVRHVFRCCHCRRSVIELKVKGGFNG